MSRTPSIDDVVPTVLRVGPWVIDAQGRRVTSPAGSSRLEPKAMAVLLQLVARRGEVVERQALLLAGWGADMATDDVLSRAISELRRALGDDPRHPRFVETVRGLGYRLIVPVEAPSTIVAVLAPHTAGNPTTAGAHARRGPRILPTPAGWLGAVLVLIVAVLLVAAHYRTRPPETSPSVPRMRPITTQPGEESGPSLSPDGTRIAYAWLDEQQQEQHIYVRLLDGGSEVKITRGVGQHMYPAWSPDGARLVFVKSDSGRWGIYEAPGLGGAERLVTRVSGPLIVGLDWSADGKRLAYAAHDSAMSPFEIRLFTTDSLAERRLSDGGGAAFGDVYPAFSPDGRLVAFVRFFTEAAADVFVVPVAGGTPRRLTFEERTISAVEFAPDGKSVLFATDRGGRWGVWRVPIEGGRRLTMAFESAGGISGLAAGRTASTLIVAESDRDLNLWSVSTTGVGVPSRLLASTRVDGLPRHSPDGARIAFVSDRSGQSEVWVAGAVGDDPVRLTRVGGVSSAPAWSPDGSRIAFERQSRAGSALWVADLERRDARPVSLVVRDAVAPSWSRDGRWLYVSSQREGRWEVWRVPVVGGGAEQVTSNGGLGARETPDGQALLFTKPSTPGLWRMDLQTRREVLLQPEVTAGDWTNWDVGTDGVYFVHRRAAGQQDILFRAFGSATNRTIARQVRVPVGTGGIALASDQRSLVFAQIDRRDGDLSIVTTVRR